MKKKIASILPKISKDAPKLYENFWHNALDMYQSISEEYKDKMAEVISNELTWLEKHADNVEPKFHEGDWAVSNLDGKARQISEVHFDEYNSYYVVDGKSVNLKEYDRLHHLWTIQDAKDGDVLCTDSTICLFKYCNGKALIKFYCQIPLEGKLYEWNFKEQDSYTDIYTEANIHPATKEQRDLLFQKMKEAGYEWDAEKKELKKEEVDNLHNYLYGEQKTAWSEEDEATISRAISIIKWAVNGNLSYPIINKQGATELVERLESLKERYTWKPSDEQMDALFEALPTRCCSNPLFSLYKDLEKL